MPRFQQQVLIIHNKLDADEPKVLATVSQLYCYQDSTHFTSPAALYQFRIEFW
jgi:hypothetical protein